MVDTYLCYDEGGFGFAGMRWGWRKCMLDIAGWEKFRGNGDKLMLPCTTLL